MTHNHPKLSGECAAELPSYLKEVYDWAYINPRHAAWLDHDWVVRVLLFAHDQCLIGALLQQLQPGMKVWLVAHVYGSLVRRMADRIGAEGRLDLTDITPVQLEHAQLKLEGLSQARVLRADAALHAGSGDYQLIASFFLLHEVPDDLKRRIVDNMLRQLPPGGRALFVDYHRPAWWHPVGWLLRGVNRWLEPFAATMWRHELAAQAQDFVWSKRTRFGGVYQVVLAERKSGSRAP
jgi:SAM-dependent methyltransferase